MAYFKIGECDKAREDFNVALEIVKDDEGERKNIEKALYDLKAKEIRDRKREKEVSRQMFKFPKTVPKP